MITRKQLESLGLTPSDSDSTLYVVKGSWDYGYRYTTQEFFSLDDGFEEELLGKITDFDLLQELWTRFGEI